MCVCQICGNAESVSFLSEWLQLWQARGSMAIRGCTDEENSTPQDVDCDYQQSESDNDDSEESLKNVLLVTGPVGVCSILLRNLLTFCLLNFNSYICFGKGF